MVTLRVRAGLLLAAALLAGGCSQIVVPVEPALVAGPRPVPVVLVPGITGTRLRDPATARLVWGNGRAVVRPHDGGYALVKPIRPGDDRPGGALEPAGVVESVRLGPIRKEVYGPIARLLERHGYTLGDLDAPRPQDGVFLFGYDWRLENPVSAGRLAEALERLRQARGANRLDVDLVCQSNGAHVCRWYAKYGGGSLEQAESAAAGPPPGVRVRKLILISSSNGGSLENLAWLNRGRRYVPLVGRRWTPEAILSIRAVFEDLPVYTEDLLVDEAGAPLAVDLFDPATWRRYGWSIFAPRVARRIERSGRADLFATPADREAYLARVLDRAKRFHDLLRRDSPGFDGTRYYMIQNVDADTPARAVLSRTASGWRTRFAGDRWLRRRPRLAEGLVEPGDGHATVDSQLWLSPQERLALVAEPARVDGDHFELILAPAAQSHLLAFLAAPESAEAAPARARSQGGRDESAGRGGCSGTGARRRTFAWATSQLECRAAADRKGRKPVGLRPLTEIPRDRGARSGRDDQTMARAGTGR